MSRLIDAIKLISEMMDAIRHGCHEEDMLDIVNEQPTVDAVPVVYCKNCIYRGNPMKCPVVELQDNTNDYDYCSKGVMRK